MAYLPTDIAEIHPDYAHLPIREIVPELALDMLTVDISILVWITHVVASAKARARQVV